MADPTRNRSGQYVRLHKDGDAMGIEARCNTEEEFVEAVAFALSELIQGKRYDGDWAFQLERWIDDIVEICCSYRGYKTAVETETVRMSGYCPPGRVSRYAGPPFEAVMGENGWTSYDEDTTRGNGTMSGEMDEDAGQ